MSVPDSRMKGTFQRGTTMVGALTRAIFAPHPLTDVNKIRHHCKYQRRFAPTVIHIVGTVHSHRRNTHHATERFIEAK